AVMLVLGACSNAATPVAHSSSSPSATPAPTVAESPTPSPTSIAVTPTPTSTPVPAGPLEWAAAVRVNHQPSFAGSSLNAVSCSLSSLCVAVDDAGNVATSTTPTGGMAAWTVTKVDGTNILL